MRSNSVPLTHAEHIAIPGIHFCDISLFELGDSLLAYAPPNPFGVRYVPGSELSAEDAYGCSGLYFGVGVSGSGEIRVLI